MSKPSAAKSGLPPLRILLVDDHPDTLKSICGWMRRRGYTVMTATNVADAEKAAVEEPFDVLVSDLGLPDGNGWQLVPRLRKARKFTAIAISGFSEEKDFRRSREAGFVRHLVKPFDPRVLHTILEEVSKELKIRDPRKP